MTRPTDWAQAYARQADADFQMWEWLNKCENALECHRLHFLQMACEKMVKAHLIKSEGDVAKVQKSHAYIRKHLPMIVRHFCGVLNVRCDESLMKAAKHIAKEIGFLSPAVGCQQRRPDNCEYPWDDGGGEVRVPRDWYSEQIAGLLQKRHGCTILKVIRTAIKAKI